jgi:hypothetical protein
VVLAFLLAFHKVARFARVMVLAIGDHCASKVALTYFLTSHKVACFVEVGVLAVFLNLPSFFYFLFVFLASLIATLSMAFLFKII